MDSLTHIVLGAAAGEIIAGKKIGNRAMAWGAIGCTIPDFDVFATFFTDPIGSISFHRGIMHSLVFTLVMPWLLAWLMGWFYDKGVYRRPAAKGLVAFFWLTLCLAAAFGLNMLLHVLESPSFWYVLAVSGVAIGWLIRTLWSDYLKKDLPPVELPYRTWLALFFVTMVLHPFLDSFTNWGTQFWQPFSNERIQWCTMAVADPLCTVPFLILIIVAARLRRGSPVRAWVNALGLIWFWGYIGIYSVWHKSIIEPAFKKSLQEHAITYRNYYTNPSILNNVVWYGVAEGDTAFYYSMYGFNDRVPGFKKIAVIPKNRSLLHEVPQDSRAMKFIQWFSKGYYQAHPYNGDTLEIADLRFGVMGDSVDQNNFPFQFLLYKNGKGVWDIRESNRNRGNLQKAQKSFGELWNKVKGE